MRSRQPFQNATRPALYEMAPWFLQATELSEYVLYIILKLYKFNKVYPGALVSDVQLHMDAYVG